MQKATSQAEWWAKLRYGDHWKSLLSRSALNAMTISFARVLDPRRNRPRDDVANAAGNTVADMLRNSQVVGGTRNHANALRYSHTGTATISSWISPRNTTFTSVVRMMDEPTTTSSPYEHMTIFNEKGGSKPCLSAKCVRTVVQ
jgi:hypothetical protein